MQQVLLSKLSPNGCQPEGRESHPTPGLGKEAPSCCADPGELIQAQGEAEQVTVRPSTFTASYNEASVQTAWVVERADGTGIKDSL